METLLVKPFEEKNIPLVVDIVLPLWAEAWMSQDFAHLYVEYIVRNNIFKNEWALELVDERGCFRAAVFGMEKGDSNTAGEWLDSVMAGNNLTPPEIKSVNSCKSYLSQMDERTLHFMNSDDVKLSLFVSNSPGSGSRLLSELEFRFRRRNFKHLYLWTDSSCNWKYYPDHNFELVEEGVFEEAEDAGGCFFQTYIFRRGL